MRGTAPARGPALGRGGPPGPHWAHLPRRAPSRRRRLATHATTARQPGEHAAARSAIMKRASKCIELVAVHPGYPRSWSPLNLWRGWQPRLPGTSVNSLSWHGHDHAVRPETGQRRARVPGQRRSTRDRPPDGASRGSSRGAVWSGTKPPSCQETRNGPPPNSGSINQTRYQVNASARVVLSASALPVRGEAPPSQAWAWSTVRSLEPRRVAIVDLSAFCKARPVSVGSTPA